MDKEARLRRDMEAFRAWQNPSPPQGLNLTILAKSIIETNSAADVFATPEKYGAAIGKAVVAIAKAIDRGMGADGRMENVESPGNTGESGM